LPARLSLVDHARRAPVEAEYPTLTEWYEMSASGTKRTWIGGQSMSALPQFSDIDLLGHGKRIVHLDP